jgi:hypothetical protein
MLLRIFDFAGFDKELDLPDGITIADLRDILRSNFQYDLTRSCFYHNGAELPPSTHLHPSAFSDSNLIVLLNSSLFPPKSYPKVDRAFSFHGSRFQEAFFKPTVQSEADGDDAAVAPSVWRRYHREHRLDDRDDWALQEPFDPMAPFPGAARFPQVRLRPIGGAVDPMEFMAPFGGLDIADDFINEEFDE